MTSNEKKFEYKDEDHLRALVTKVGLGQVSALELAGVQGDTWIWHVFTLDQNEYLLKLYPVKKDNLSREVTICEELQGSPILYPKVICSGQEQNIGYIFFDWMGEYFTTPLLNHPDSIISQLLLSINLGGVTAIETLPFPFLALKIDTAEHKSYILKIYPMHRTDALEQQILYLKELVHPPARMLKTGAYLGFFYIILDWIDDEFLRQKLLEDLEKGEQPPPESPPPFAIEKTSAAAAIFLTDSSEGFDVPKELLDIEGVSLLSLVIQAYSACCSTVFVFASSADNPALAIAKAEGAEIVVLPDSVGKITTPIEFALELIASQCNECIGMFLASINTPITDPTTLITLLQAPKSPSTLLAFPCYHGMTGDPIWISPSVLSFFNTNQVNSTTNRMARNIIRMIGSSGLGVLKVIPEMAKCIDFIQVSNPEVIITLNTPKHIQKWLSFRKRRD